MSEKKDECGDTTKPQRSAEELRIALHTAETNLRTVREARKNVMASYKEQLKLIDDEIVGILDQLKLLEKA